MMATATILFWLLVHSNAFIFPYDTKIKEWNFLHQEPAITLSDIIAKEPTDTYDIVYDLMSRVLGGTSLLSQFKLELIMSNTTASNQHLPIYKPKSTSNHPFWSKTKSSYLDIIELDNNGSNIILRGTSIIALTNAFNWYLEDFANTTYDWRTYTVNMPTSPLPLPPYTQKIRSVPFMYYQNVCTVSYTFAFWDWNTWQQHLDWMAMQGINMPLSFNGQEYIWAKTFAQFGFNTTDLSSFFSGPGFYAWNRMGNIQGWGGPLRESEIINQYNLQLQILARMSSFQMIPVLTCFAGHVPDAITTIYPNVDVSPSPPWGAFQIGTPGEPYCCSLLLNFSDPLFGKIGAKFIEIQTKYYGTSHVYQCDSFNEEMPPSNDTIYLYNASSQVYKAIESVDVNGIWMLQTWLFYFQSAFWNTETVKTYLSGVDKDEVLLLDVYSDGSTVYNLFDSFYGLPFIWNTVNTFGGKDGFYGYLDNISVGLTNALASNSSVLGVGMMLEGIWTNYVAFDMTLKMAYHGPFNPMNESLFIDKYVYRRYGIPHTINSSSDQIWIINNLQQSWDLFQTDVYNTVKYAGTIITWPTPTMSSSNKDNLYVHVDEPVYYDKAMMQIWEYYIQIGTNGGLNNVVQFMHDLTDITRQCLGDLFDNKYKMFESYYHKYNFSNANDVNNKYVLNQTKIIGSELMEIIMDLDNILNTNEYYMVGRWIEWAKNKSNGNKSNTEWLEFNARNQITLWGPGQPGQFALNNYARKQWGGVIKDYYGSQWELFINMIIQGMENNVPFNQTYFDEQNFVNNQLKWVHATNIYPTTPIGDTVEISCQYFLKWNTLNVTSCNHIRGRNYVL
eukprot:320330_1